MENMYANVRVLRAHFYLIPCRHSEDVFDILEFFLTYFRFFILAKVSRSFLSQVEVIMQMLEE